MMHKERSETNYQQKEKAPSGIYRSKEDARFFYIKSIVRTDLSLSPQEAYSGTLSEKNLHLCSIDYNELYLFNKLRLKSYTFTTFLITKHLRLRSIPITLENILKHQSAFVKTNVLTKDMVESSLLILCQKKFLTTHETRPENIPTAKFTLNGAKNCSKHHKIKTSYYDSKIMITNYTSEFFKTLSTENDMLSLCNSHFIDHIFFQRPTTYQEIEYITGLNRYHFRKIKSLSKKEIKVYASLPETDSEFLSGIEHKVDRKKVVAKIQTNTVYQKNYSPFIAKINKHTNNKFPYFGNVFKDNDYRWSSLVEAQNKLQYIKEKAESESDIETTSLTLGIYNKKRKGCNFSYLSDSAKVKYLKRWEKTVLTNTRFDSCLFESYKK